MKAMEAYQRRWRRRYPSWREVLYVIECLGYRKVAKARPADASPPTQAELAFAATARKALESVSPQLPV